jgi:large subunit ribosomal protein L9
MQVILKEDVHNLGKSGELVQVKPGFGRNYLIPQGLAMVATSGNIKQIEHEKKIIAAKNAKLLKDAQSIADRLAAVEVQIERATAAASDQGPAKEGEAAPADKLFGSVTSRDIAEALTAKGVTVDHKKIVLPEPIKTIGYHTVDVKLGNGITGKLKVVVIAKTA